MCDDQFQGTYYLSNGNMWTAPYRITMKADDVPPGGGFMSQWHQNLADQIFTKSLGLDSLTPDPGDKMALASRSCSGREN